MASSQLLASLARVPNFPLKERSQLSRGVSVAARSRYFASMYFLSWLSSSVICPSASMTSKFVVISYSSVPRFLSPCTPRTSHVSSEYAVLTRSCGLTRIEKQRAMPVMRRRAQKQEPYAGSCQQSAASVVEADLYVRLRELNRYRTFKYKIFSNGSSNIRPGT